MPKPTSEVSENYSTTEDLRIATLLFFSRLATSDPDSARELLETLARVLDNLHKGRIAREASVD